jgi:hypothetical protein
VIFLKRLEEMRFIPTNILLNQLLRKEKGVEVLILMFKTTFLRAETRFQLNITKPMFPVRNIGFAILIFRFLINT